MRIEARKRVVEVMSEAGAISKKKRGSKAYTNGMSKTRNEEKPAQPK